MPTVLLAVAGLIALGLFLRSSVTGDVQGAFGIVPGSTQTVPYKNAMLTTWQQTSGQWTGLAKLPSGMSTSATALNRLAVLVELQAAVDLAALSGGL
jgi:hypothetical protein